MPKRKPPFTSNGRGAHCAYCQRRLEAIGSRSRLAATRDHVVPKSHGGHRRVWCCRQCNTLKANMMPWEWKSFMSRTPEWWRRPEFQYGIRLKDRSDYLGPAPLTVGTEAAGATRDDRQGMLAPDNPQAAGAGCDPIAHLGGKNDRPQTL